VHLDTDYNIETQHQAANHWEDALPASQIPSTSCDRKLQSRPNINSLDFTKMGPNPLADFGGGLSSKSLKEHPAGPPQHGPTGQAERAFTAASTFMSGVMAISATQFLGAPLKMIDPKFYEAYMAFTKQSFGVLITTMTQWWSPTVVRVSGDQSIPKQLFQKPDGTLQCRFPKRIVMMANHQVGTKLDRVEPFTDFDSYTRTGCTCGGLRTLTTCTVTSTSSSKSR